MVIFMQISKISISFDIFLKRLYLNNDNDAQILISKDTLSFASE